MQQRDRQILHIALPSIVSNITVPLLGLVDVAITGHLGSSAYIGAIAVGSMLFNALFWMFAFLRMGASGMTSQALGGRRLTEVVNVLLRSLLVSLFISLAMLLLQVPVRELALSLIAPSADVAAYARTYYNICIWGAPACLSLYALTGWFVGMQNSRAPMVVAVVQNVSNIAASLVLVRVFGLTIDGVAWGTVLSQYIGLSTALFLLFRNYMRLKKYLCIGMVLSKEPLRLFFSVNKDIFLRTCCLILVHFSFIAAGAKIGDTELAVNTMLMQLFMLYSYIMDGFSFAGEALVGKAVGSRSHSIYKDTVGRLFRWGWLVASVFTLAYLLLGKPFLSLLTDDASVIDASVVYHPWSMLIPLCGMAAFIWDGIYVGATATKGMLVSMAVSMLVFVLLGLLLVPVAQNHGLWIAFLAYLASRGIVQTLMRNTVWPTDEN